MIDMLEALKEKVGIRSKHKWGEQIELVNEPEYCGKFLVLVGRDVWGSLHYHKEKKETFIVLCGAVYLDVAAKDEHEWSTVYNGILVPGEQITINPYERHKMQNSFDSTSIILEVSTHDEDSDTYRIGGDNNDE